MFFYPYSDFSCVCSDPRASTRFDADDINLETVELNPSNFQKQSKQAVHSQHLQSAYSPTGSPPRHIRVVSSPTKTIPVESLLSDGDWSSSSEDERSKVNQLK